MIRIDGKEIRTESEQVWKNMEDIDKLKETIKPEYTTAESLTSSSTSVAIANTNAPSGTKSGWLLTQDGLKFKITGGDDTNLLLEFYANLKGPQGESGAAVNIDDSAVSLTKVWSSQKTYLETAIGNDKGIFYTTVAPVLSSGTTYDFDLDDVANDTSTKKPKIKDLVIYIYNGVPSQVYEVLNDNSSVESLKLVGTYSQGKQLYQHNILIYKDGSRYYDYLFLDNIINDSPNQMTYSDIISYLGNNGYNYDENKPRFQQNMFKLRGWNYDSNTSTYTYYEGVLKYSATEIRTYNATGYGDIDISSGWTIVDTIIAS